MTQALRNAISNAGRNKCTVKLLGGRSYLVITPERHRYVVRFSDHDGQRFAKCCCKAASARMTCFHLVPAAMLDTAIQQMRAH